MSKARLRIGIDISQIVYGTGVSVYTSNLVENLLKVDHENEYVLFGGSMRRFDELKRLTKGFFEKNNGSGGLVRFPPFLADLVWNRWHVISPSWVFGKLNVYHSSDWAQAPSRAFKVTTVHDLAVIKYPELFHFRIVNVHKRRLAWVKKEIDRVIVPSEATRNDLIKEGFEGEKIRVIPEAVESKYKKLGAEAVVRIRHKYGISPNFLLVVGGGKRKNVGNIIKAFEMLRNKGWDLVITGSEDDNKKEAGVKRLGYVDEQELIGLYSGAMALVYVSSYEGFGLPILQAMACECPVVTSNVSSLPEVTGGAAVTVEPNDYKEIARGIEKVVRERAVWVSKGRRRVKGFSWEKSARMTMNVYREAL